MAYFTYFPTINYTIDVNSLQFMQAKDILRRVKFTEYFKTVNGSSSSIFISEGEKPETMSYKLYGRADLHWMILLFNEIHNAYFEWPMDSHQLEAHMTKKYPGIAVYLRSSTIEVTEGSDVYYATEMDGTYSLLGKVHRWDPTYLKLEVENSDRILSGGYIRFDSSTTGDPIGIFRSELNPYSIHHFQDQYGLTLSPIASVAFQDQIGLPNETGKKPLILSYAEAGSTPEIAQLAVDNYTYEQIRNDGKREIRVIEPSQVDRMARVVRDLMTQR